MPEIDTHCLGVIGGVAFGMNRRAFVKAAKVLEAQGLVTMGPTCFGQNRAHYAPRLTPLGEELLACWVRNGQYPLASRTRKGREILGLDT